MSNAKAQEITSFCKQDEVLAPAYVCHKGSKGAKTLSLPRHVAIILDGNRRWARNHSLPISSGHIKGAQAVEPILEYAARLGIEALTLYMFSTENWRRSEKEVDELFTMMEQYLSEHLHKVIQKGIKLLCIGQLDKVPVNLRQRLMEAVEATKQGKTLTVVLAINYGARAELVHAAQNLATKVKEGLLEPSDIREWHISELLGTHPVGDPELFIRTSGERRISNFLLWQLAYSELYFTDVLWPDFTPLHFEKALEHYSLRQRRFGV